MPAEQRPVREKGSEEGGSLVEYVLLVSLIAIVCLVSVAYFGTRVDSRFSKVGSAVEAPARP